MSRVRRPELAAQAERRGREVVARLGSEIHAMRERRGWSQAELGKRSGLGRTLIGRLERAEARADVDALERIGLALGRPPTVTFGRDPLDGPADAGHLAIQELVLRVGRVAGYRTGFELPTRPAEPWRSADVALRHDGLRLLVIVECWNTIGDVGAAARSSERKRAEAEGLARSWWGEAAQHVGLAWVVRDTVRNRALVARYPEVFASRFPGSSPGWLGTLTRATPPPLEPGLVWADRDGKRVFARRRR